jgi:hypothetical protein
VLDEGELNAQARKQRAKSSSPSPRGSKRLVAPRPKKPAWALLQRGNKMEIICGGK